MYTICYYMNHQPYNYTFCFESLWAAVFKARCIFEEHGFATNVMDSTTGEIIAIFEPNNIWIANEVAPNVRYLAQTPLK